jgi:hsp70-interacting protein
MPTSKPPRNRRRRHRSRGVIVTRIACFVALALVARIVVVADAHTERPNVEDAADVNVDAAAAADEFYDTLPSDPATLSQLFQWSIENSDLDALREMADGTTKGKPGTTGVKIDDDKAESWVARAVRRFVARATSSMTSSSTEEPMRAIDGSTQKVTTTTTTQDHRRRYTEDELERKKRDVREALDFMKSRPSPHELAKECGNIVRNAAKNETVERRVAALEILYDVVGPIDVANDLDKMGIAEALIGALSDEEEEVASGAASVLAAAASNNGIVQGIIYDRGGFDVLLELVASSQTPLEVRDKCLWVLGMCARTHEASRVKFFAEGGARILADIVSPKTPVKMRSRGIVLFGDLLTIDGVPQSMFSDERLAREIVESVARAGVARSASLDEVEKSLAALRSALDRAPDTVRVDIERSFDFDALAERLENDVVEGDEIEYARDVASVARRLAARERDEL